MLFCVLNCVLISVHFRYVVFRPFVDEILVGKIKSCSKEGVNGKLFCDYCKMFIYQINNSS